MKDSFAHLFRRSGFSRFSPSSGQIATVDDASFRSLKRPIPALVRNPNNLPAAVCLKQVPVSTISKSYSLLRTRNYGPDPIFRHDSILSQSVYAMDMPFGNIPFDDKTFDLFRFRTLVAICLSGIPISRKTPQNAQSTSYHPETIVQDVRNQWLNVTNRIDIAELLCRKSNVCEKNYLASLPISPLKLQNGYTVQADNCMKKTYFMPVLGRLIGRAENGFAVTVGGWIAHLPRSNIPLSKTATDFYNEQYMKLSDRYRVSACQIDESVGNVRITLLFEE